MDSKEELVGAYIDGELDVEAASKVEQLISTDPEARRIAEICRDTVIWLRAACGERAYASRPPVLPPSGRLSILHTTARRQVLYAIAASVAAVAVFGGGVLAARWLSLGSDSLVDEVAEYHNAFSRETDHLVEVPASHADELAAWLGGRLERRLPIPDLSSVGLRFAGGRMLVIDDRPVAELMYTRERGLPVALCIAKVAAHPSVVRLDERDRLRIASWNDGGYAYYVVGELDATLARDIADRVAAQLRG